MTLTLEIPADVQRELANEAAIRGVAVPDLAASLLTELAGRFADAAWSSDNFFKAKTIDQLIAEQGVSPVADINIFSGVIPDDDLDEFIADIYKGRAA